MSQELKFKQGVLAQIKQKRKEKNLDQTTLGKMAGLSQSTISQVEKGDKGLSVESLFRVCESLGLELQVVEKQVG